MDKTGKKIYIWSFVFFLIAVFFTISRSSILGLSIAIAIYHLIGLKSLIPKFRIKKVLIFNIIIFFAAIVGIIILSPYHAERIINRFVGITGDPSAQHRLNDMMLAVDLLSDYETLIFGIGFNFFKYLQLTWGSSVDSSIFTLFVTLGIPLSIIVVLLLTSLLIYSRPQNPFQLAFYKQVLLIYLAASAVISNFNNLLFYVFWILWVLPIICYFYLLKRERPFCQLMPECIRPQVLAPI